ncbi:D-aminoacyl-tRNA deacylase [Filifactor villosus]|uniref:D-aminoacyl-tRNA deacylase n=1 Tax=Filifactor villosus TaxID=29374 RepID=A0ABV9QP80_9FIRM
MRLVIQRVLKASVQVGAETVGQCKRGYMVLVAVTHEDTQKDVAYCVEKTAGLRIFEDEEEKMNLSIRDIGGEILAVSQFTLYADTRKGKRPSFVRSARPDYAEKLYEEYVEGLRQSGIHVETGRFGATMQVELINDGPVTILIDSSKLF